MGGVFYWTNCRVAIETDKILSSIASLLLKPKEEYFDTTLLLHPTIPPSKGMSGEKKKTLRLYDFWRDTELRNSIQAP